MHLQTRTSTVSLYGTMTYKAHINNSHSSQELTKKVIFKKPASISR